MMTSLSFIIHYWVATSLTATWHLGFCHVNVASAYSLGDMALPCHSCCGGCRQQMWVVAAIDDGVNEATVGGQHGLWWWWLRKRLMG
jgi:hypothetical protein